MNFYTLTFIGPSEQSYYSPFFQYVQTTGEHIHQSYHPPSFSLFTTRDLTLAFDVHLNIHKHQSYTFVFILDFPLSALHYLAAIL